MGRGPPVSPAPCRAAATSSPSAVLGGSEEEGCPVLYHTWLI